MYIILLVANIPLRDHFYDFYAFQISYSAIDIVPFLKNVHSGGMCIVRYIISLFLYVSRVVHTYAQLMFT